MTSDTNTQGWFGAGSVRFGRTGSSVWANRAEPASKKLYNFFLRFRQFCFVNDKYNEVLIEYISWQQH